MALKFTPHLQLPSFHQRSCLRVFEVCFFAVGVWRWGETPWSQVPASLLQSASKVLASHEIELSRLAEHLNRVEAVLGKRKLEYVSTEFLFGMAASLRSQIRKQRVVPVFSASPSGDSPEPNPQPSTPNLQPTQGQP